METNLILSIGIIIVVGFFGGVLARKVKFPRVTGYIVIGILLSPSLWSLLGLSPIVPQKWIIGEAGNPGLTPITDIALGIIAYLVGGSLRLKDLRQLEKTIIWIVPFEACGAWILVTLLLSLLGPFVFEGSGTVPYQTYFAVALVIGAVSCATAPAATMAIIREYKAKGPLTTTLLAIVAIDDAIAVIAFAIALSAASAITGGGLSLHQMIAFPFVQIFGSIGVGIAFGYLMLKIARLARTRELLLVTVFGVLMLCVGLCKCAEGWFDLSLSYILATMSAGFIVTNWAKREEMFSVVEEIEEVVFAMFFVLAGMHFDLGVMRAAGIIAMLIVLGRCFGKYAGARTGATVSHAPDVVKRYLGFALLPKAGVTVGLALLAGRAFSPAMGVLIINAVLASVIINELIAPPLTKYAITKAGEAA
jgi:Kef-type K+ transport system membrane component KefB